MKMFKPSKARFIHYEFITTILWFALDASWLFEWLWIANTFSILVVISAVLTICHTRRNIRDQASSLAILLWVSMSAFWVTGDMNEIPWAMFVAKICAGGTLLCLLTAKKFRRVRF